MKSLRAIVFLWILLMGTSQQQALALQQSRSLLELLASGESVNNAEVKEIVDVISASYTSMAKSVRVFPYMASRLCRLLRDQSFVAPTPLPVGVPAGTVKVDGALGVSKSLLGRYCGPNDTIFTHDFQDALASGALIPDPNDPNGKMILNPDYVAGADAPNSWGMFLGFGSGNSALSDAGIAALLAAPHENWGGSDAAAGLAGLSDMLSGEGRGLANVYVNEEVISSNGESNTSSSQGPAGIESYVPRPRPPSGDESAAAWLFAGIGSPKAPQPFGIGVIKAPMPPLNHGTGAREVTSRNASTTPPLTSNGINEGNTQTSNSTQTPGDGINNPLHTMGDTSGNAPPRPLSNSGTIADLANPSLQAVIKRDRQRVAEEEAIAGGTPAPTSGVSPAVDIISGSMNAGASAGGVTGNLAAPVGVGNTAVLSLKQGDETKDVFSGVKKREVVKFYCKSNPDVGQRVLQFFVENELMKCREITTIMASWNFESRGSCNLGSERASALTIAAESMPDKNLALKCAAADMAVTQLCSSVGKEGNLPALYFGAQMRLVSAIEAAQHDEKHKKDSLGEIVVSATCRRPDMRAQCHQNTSEGNGNFKSGLSETSKAMMSSAFFAQTPLTLKTALAGGLEEAERMGCNLRPIFRDWVDTFNADTADGRNIKFKSVTWDRMQQPDALKFLKWLHKNYKHSGLDQAESDVKVLLDFAVTLNEVLSGTKFKDEPTQQEAHY